MESRKQKNATPILKDLKIDRKKAHSQQIISIGCHPNNPEIFSTTSEDRTARLWDLRVGSTVKLIKSPEMSKKNAQLANPIMDDKQRIHIPVSNRVYSYDLRKQGIMVTAPSTKTISQLDEINHIVMDSTYSILAACDDEGDTHIYDPNPKQQISLVQTEIRASKYLRQKHKNISYCTEFIYPEQYKEPVCVTTGFDTSVIFWDLSKTTQTQEDELDCEPIKEINLAEVMKKYVQVHCPPLIYSVLGMKASVLLTTQTGHVVCLALNEPKKPKFILEASLSKVVRSCFAKFNPNIYLTAGVDGTFAAWDWAKRDMLNTPSFICRYQMPEQVNWIETTDKYILVADKTEYLQVFNVKG